MPLLAELFRRVASQIRSTLLNYFLAIFLQYFVSVFFIFNIFILKGINKYARPVT